MMLAVHQGRPQLPSEQALKTKLAGALARARYLTVVSLRPDLAPRTRKAVTNLLVSAHAEIGLRYLALDQKQGRQREG